MSKVGLDLVGIGNAIVDVLSRAPDSFLIENKIEKGAMTLIEADRAEEIYGRMGPAIEVSGGSVANTIAAFAAMGGAAAFIGKVADDQLGRVFRHDIRASGVRFETPPLTGGAPTARCLILVTPDAQRSMSTYLGACVWLTPADLDEAAIAAAQITYLEGYIFDRPHAKEALRRAAAVARGAGRRVALSLSDSFCVQRHREEFLDFIQADVDILFANEAEITSLYQTTDFGEAVHHVRQHCALAALTRGAQGSVVVTPEGAEAVEAAPVSRIVDTTGAGDMYAAGFLYGCTRGLSPRRCAEAGALMAAEVLGHMGARPQSDLTALIREKIAV